MMSEQFSVSWDNFHKNMSSGVHSLLENEDFVDVTLAVEGRYLKAHKMVLSVCSPYFRELFKSSPCKHPIVFMKDVSYIAMNDLLQFMYQGEVKVSQANFTTFIKTAECLQIRGLSNYGNIPIERGDADGPLHEKMTISKPDVPKNSKPNEPRQTLHSPAPSQPSLVKVEPPPGVATNASTTPVKDDLIQFKMEPYDQEQSPAENFSDDPLDETNADDMNEDYWMMEGGDEEGQVGTSGDGVLEGEGLILSDIEDVTASTMSPLIPERSKDKYEQAFIRFEQWCGEKNVNSINENVLMTYFKEKSITYKSSSLWSIYSMLRSMISIKKNIDISKYRNLSSFLKRKSKGYKAKKSEVFKREDFERFLKEANNEIYLMMKVAMIIGVAGACRRDELTYLLMENVIDEGNFIKIQLPDTRNKISREFIITAGSIENLNLIEIIRKYINLRPQSTDHQRFFLSYRLGKCTKQPVGINTFGSMPKNIARFLGLPNPEQYTGHCFRRTSASLKLVPQLINFP